MKKALLFIVLVSNFLFADATIEVIKRVEKLPTIQIQDSSQTFSDVNTNNKFFKVLVADLKVTTYFDVLETNTKVPFDYSFKGGAENSPKADIILRYQLTQEDDGSIMAATQLIDTRKNSLISKKNFKISKKINYPFLAHSITMDLSDSIGAGKIEWMGKYIIFAKYISAKESEIILADYTLTFQQVLVKGGLNIFPKWADKNQDSFYYTSYNLNKPTLYKVTLKTGQRERIIDSEGMLVATDISKDGNKLLLTMAPQDQPDVYLYNLNSKKLQQLTKFKGVDIGGNFIDNEEKIIFVSDRLGYPNIFSQKIGDSAIEQMIYHGKNNAAATSFENYVVYSSRDKMSEFGGQVFNLYLISTKTDYIRQLTATGKNLYPRFSHDGQSIVFIKEFAKESALGIIRLGSNKSFHFPLKSGKIQSIDW